MLWSSPNPNIQQSLDLPRVNFDTYSHSLSDINNGGSLHPSFTTFFPLDERLDSSTLITRSTRIKYKRQASARSSIPPKLFWIHPLSVIAHFCMSLLDTALYVHSARSSAAPNDECWIPDPNQVGRISTSFDPHFTKQKRPCRTNPLDFDCFVFIVRGNLDVLENAFSLDSHCLKN